MNGILEWLQVNTGVMLRMMMIVVAGVPLIRVIEVFSRRYGSKRFSSQSNMLIAKAVRYGLGLVLLVMLLSELGFNLTAILGAAGIVGVAMGFAAQTSLSNIISGVFLIAERSFEIGDAIQIGDTTGLVHSIDLLSVKLRTFDNRLIRLPNEMLVKNQFTNITRFPIRRFDIDIGVAYKEDVEHVTRVLAEVADKNPYCLDEPAPVILFKGFGDSALEFMVGVWFAKEDFLNLRNSMMKAIKTRFDAEGIEIPFPHRSLYAGSATDPFPIRIVGGEGAPLRSPLPNTTPA